MTKLSSFMKRKYAGGGWLDAAVDVAPYVSNIYNASKRLPAPPTPVYENPISANLVNFVADRVDLDRDLLGLNRGVDQSTANPGLSNALRVSNLGKFLEAKNRLAQTQGNLNADINNQTARFNSNLLGRNVERMNDYRNNLFGQKVNQRRLDSENLANATDKFQMQVRDKNQMNLEADKLEILKRKYRDTGVLDRNLLDLLMKNQEDLKTGKYGGNLSKLLTGGKLKMSLC